MIPTGAAALRIEPPDASSPGATGACAPAISASSTSRNIKYVARSKVRITLLKQEYRPKSRLSRFNFHPDSATGFSKRGTIHRNYKLNTPHICFGQTIVIRNEQVTTCGCGRCQLNRIGSFYRTILPHTCKYFSCPAIKGKDVDCRLIDKTPVLGLQLAISSSNRFHEQFSQG